MNVILLSLSALATLAFGSKIVLGEVRELCYTDLNNTCIVYHTKGYADGFSRIYLPPSLMNTDPHYHDLLASISIKAEPWSTFVDDIVAQRGVVPESRSSGADTAALKDALAAGKDNTVDQDGLSVRGLDRDERKLLEDVAEGLMCTAAALACGGGTLGAVGGVGLPAAAATAAACLKTAACILGG